MIRNGLDEAPAFPLDQADTVRYLGFTLDSGVARYTGDTLILELTADSAGLAVTERLRSGSPAPTGGDTGAVAYHLGLEGDSLLAECWPTPVVSRLFGTIDLRLAPFAVANLPAVQPAFQDGIPVLAGGSNVLAGRMADTVTVHGRALAGAGLMLDGRGLDRGLRGIGFIHTASGGVEKAWRFGGRSVQVTGWDRE